MVSSDHFAHAVHFNLGADFRLSDEFFDLLPGEQRIIKVERNGQRIECRVDEDTLASLKMFFSAAR